MSNKLKEYRTSMADNINAMDSLMTIFDCELYVLEHIIMCSGSCYYADVENDKVEEAFLMIMADEAGNAKIYMNITGDNPKTVELDPIDAWLYVSKDKDEVDILLQESKK